MPGRPWTGLRAGAVRVSVYNEALLVYLCDESNLGVIAESEADLEAGYGETDGETEAELKALARQGVLVAYELEQDDPVELEVVVGAPLSKAERATGPWLEAQRAALRLPGGVLRIDTANTRPDGGEEDSEEPPGRVQVPPGDYALSLYRLDWPQLPTEERAEWDGPAEILVLTPQADAKPVKAPKPLLRLPSQGTAAWLGRYAIEGEVFRGKAMGSPHAESIAFVNIDRAAAEQLGLEAGQVLSVEVAGLVLEAIYVGESDPLAVRSGWVAFHRGERNEFGAAYRPTHDVESGHALVIDRAVRSAAFPRPGHWIPATARVLDERHEVPGRPV